MISHQQEAISIVKKSWTLTSFGSPYEGTEDEVSHALTQARIAWSNDHSIETSPEKARTDIKVTVEDGTIVISYVVEERS